MILLIIQSSILLIVKDYNFLGNLWHQIIRYETFTDTS